MTKFYLKLFVLLLGVNITIAQSSEINPIAVIKKYLIDSGMNQEDINDLKIQSTSFSKSMNLTNVYVIQQHNGVPLRNAIGSFAIKEGKVVFYRGNYIANVSAKINTTRYTITPENAVRNASASLGLEAVNGITLIENNSSITNSFLFSKGNISSDQIPVSLVYELKDNKLILCWDISIHIKNGKNAYSMRIDATNGVLQSKNDMVLHCSFGNHSHSVKKSRNKYSVLKNLTTTSTMLATPSYNVFSLPAESPNHGERKLVSGIEDAEASPYGWHDTNGAAGEEYTTTRGNNVFVSEDLDGDNVPGNQPDGGDNLIFDFPYDPSATVQTFQDASMTNLFYVNNVMHDVWYKYGFDEDSGNFQVNNYGKGGEEKDEVIADAQDGSGTSNADFMTLPDGENSRMQMYLYNPSTLLFTVNNTDLKGTYEVLNNNFDWIKKDPPTLPDSLNEDLVLAVDDNGGVVGKDENDACDDLINAADLKGKIAVVRRGDCDFVDKISKCNSAGAKAVIVVNNQPGDVTMGGLFAFIPAVSINQEDGEALIAKMAKETVNVSLSTKQSKDFTGTDGAFDNGIVMHEYGHGISIRLAGGAMNTSCLDNAEQMGEGWSDWFGLMMTIEEGDKGTDSRGVGTFASGEDVTHKGIRVYPYSTDKSINPVTYEDVNDKVKFTKPHGIGSIWASILWDMTWAFIERDGFDPDLYEGTGGNNLAMQLVINGLKIQPCSPGFVDGRDAILEAANHLPNSEENKCLIWSVFANRGVGYSASQGSSNDRTDQKEANDLPPDTELDCSKILVVGEVNVGLFKVVPNPSRGVFDIKVSQSIGDSVISVFDMNGRVVFKEKTEILDTHSVKTDLRSGIYILKVEAENGSAISNSKIIIK